MMLLATIIVERRRIAVATVSDLCIRAAERALANQRSHTGTEYHGH